MESAELCSPSRTAQDLLLEFKATGNQAPFEEIVRRYGGMVYHVCLRITKNNHDAEDATQAVFLTLAVQARQNKEIRYIGPWLQQVAHRLSLDLRKSKRRRERREERHGQTSGCERVECECAQQMHFDELKGVINQEINKLPPKYRVPLIMHYFGGLSRDEMARELQCKPGTLGVRLHRAREMLGARLARRGVSMAEGTMSLAVAYAVQSVVAEQIVASTCQAASQIVFGNPTSHLVPAQLVAMARGAVHSVLIAKVKTVAALLIAMGCAVAAGAEVVAKVTPLDLGLDLQLRIGDWVKEHLLPFSTPLQVNATEAPVAPAAREPVGSSSSSSPPVFAHAPIGFDPGTFEVSTPQSIQLPPASLMLGGGSRDGGTSLVSHEAGVRQPMTIAPPVASIDVPQRVVRHWDAFGDRHASAGLASRDVPPRVRLNAPLHLNAPPPPAAPVVPVIARERDQDESPRVQRPTMSGPWRPDHPGPGRGGKGGNGSGGGGTVNPPNKPINPGNGNSGGNSGGTGNGNGSSGGNSGGRGHNAPRQPVQVAIGNDSGPGPVSMYLYNAETAVPAPRTPRSPASMYVARADSNGVPLVSGTYTNVDFNSVAGVDFNAPAPSGTIGGGAVLHTDSSFSDGMVGTPVDLDVFSGAGGAAVSRYVDRTYFTYDAPSNKLIVLGRQSRAKLTGMTLESTPGRLSGWGVVGPANSLDQSGQIVADGMGQPRVLDLTTIGVIRNITENSGANGWYARNGGMVLLPAHRVLPGTRDYTWGEEAGDQQIDLVNSVRIRVRDALNPGKLQLALAATDRADVPQPLPGGERVVGLWRLDVESIRADGMDLTVRYDDGLIADLGMNENSVRLWGYGGGAWRLVQDGFTLDSEKNLVAGSVGSVTFFAVSAIPEPGALSVLVGASLLMLRRLRQRR